MNFFLKKLPSVFLIPGSISFSPDSIHDFADLFSDILVPRRDQNIILTAQDDRLLSIGKLRMAGEKNALDLFFLLPHPAEKPQAVFSRHLDIAEKDIHRMLRNTCSGCLRIVGGIDFADAVGGPVHIFFHGLRCQLFIIHYQKVHFLPPDHRGR